MICAMGSTCRLASTIFFKSSVRLQMKGLARRSARRCSYFKGDGAHRETNCCVSTPRDARGISDAKVATGFQSSSHETPDQQGFE